MDREHVVIVGGTSGIGLATARYLDQKGYTVTIAGRSAPPENKFNRCHCDIRDEDSVKNLFHSLEDKNLTGLVYASGITGSKVHISKFDKKVWHTLVETNVTGALLCIKYGYELLKKTQGRIVIVNSLAARTYSKYSGFEYTMTKASLSGMVKQLAIQLAEDNIQINSVYPGMTKTPMLIQNVDKELLAQEEKVIPLQRLAEPEDVARVIHFLVSKENGYMTGAGIDVNGGQFMNG